MEITLLVKSFLGLVILLGGLLFFLLYSPKKSKIFKKPSKPKVSTSREYPSLEDLVHIIKDKNSTAEELGLALEKVLKYYGTIHPKLGIRAHPDFNIYGEILLRICRHPHTNKDIILNFNRALEEKNPEYKREINDFITKGLNSRGF